MIAYYFAPENNRLRYGDNRKIVVGETHEVSCIPKCCKQGLHASIRPIDALQYAGGNDLYIVDITGNVDKNSDKICGTSRKYLYKIENSEDILRDFARAVALEAMLKELPNADPIIFEWLRTGNGEIRSAARSAVESAVWSSVGSSARSAARSAAWSAMEAAARSSAESAAWEAAESSARSARSAAGLAAWSAAREAARSAQNKILLKLIAKYGRFSNVKS